jgi:hypothetical protein
MMMSCGDRRLVETHDISAFSPLWEGMVVFVFKGLVLFWVLDLLS